MDGKWTVGKKHATGRPRLPFHYGYAVFLGACLMMLPQSLPINAASIFFVPVTQELSIAKSTFGVHTTIISLSIFLTTALVSRMFNRCNLRVFMCGVVLLEAACLFAYSLAQSVWTFYVSSFFIGAALSVLVYMVVPVLVNNWFSTRTNLFIGIGTAMQGVGGALFNSLGSCIIAGWGWRTCYVVFACVTLAIGLPVSALVLRRSPADMGLLPIDYKQASKEKSMGGLGATGSGSVGPTATVQQQAPLMPGISLHDAARTPAFYVVIATCLFLSCGIIFNYYINAYVQDLGATITQAGLASSLVMVGMCLGKVALGALCDRSMAAGVAAGCGCGMAACLVLAGLRSATIPVIFTACLLFGVCYASSSLLGAALTRHAFGPADFGTIWPIAGMFIALGNAFGSTFWGFVTEACGYRAGLVLDALVIFCALALGLVCVRLGTHLHARWK